MKVSELRQWVRRFDRAHGVHLENCCGEVTVTQCHTLLELDVAEENLSSADLSRRLSLDPSTVSRMIDKLEKQKLIVRLPGADRRSGVLALSENGQRVVDELNEEAVSFYGKVLEQFSKKEQESIMQGLRQLTEGMEQLQQEFNCCAADSSGNKEANKN